MDSRTVTPSARTLTVAALAIFLGLGWVRSARTARASEPASADVEAQGRPALATVAKIPGLTLLSSLRSPATDAPRQATQEAAIVQALIGLLGDTLPAVREAAADALGERGESARPAVPALVTALSDPQRRVRAQAAEALGVIGDAAAVGPLGDRLSSEPDRSVAQEAAEALGRIGTAEAASRLEAALVAASLRDDGFRRVVVQALGRTGQPAAVDRLEDLFPLADRRLQQTILEAFAEAGTPSAATALVRMIQSADPNLRLMAVRALGGDATPGRPR